jgi:hypothetical protein
MDSVRTSQETRYVSATETNRVITFIGLLQWYADITVTVLDIIRHPLFYLKHTTDVRTSLETHYV